jgi:hypothetical protein
VRGNAGGKRFVGVIGAAALFLAQSVIVITLRSVHFAVLQAPAYYHTAILQLINEMELGPYKKLELCRVPPFEKVSITAESIEYNRAIISLRTKKKSPPVRITKMAILFFSGVSRG